ncbi:Multidrug resistance-associated protein/mitoxantrone resistance protein, ABC superfamily [Phaffia rhodozyma]|uniref:Multidrug resistance-associated protein/mitoxantrone resistance protein, ABC superfamily n=1 Tax=Phaffia rhodozyma TaxID=264483 RepID=A0A0F7SF67_PHARH|nr:Multidrug resistance-associated protein/mitoxantrone resistance protein, ABC superfamily [Phaffia rhodozyma]
MLRVGYSRPLELDDFWELTDEYKATRLAIALEKNFYDRVPPSRRPMHLRPKLSGLAQGSEGDEKLSGIELENLEAQDHEPTQEIIKNKATKTKQDAKDEKRSKEPMHPPKVTEDEIVYDQSLLLALQKTVFWRFWIGGMIGVCAVALLTTGPLVSQLILNYITTSYNYAHREPGQDLPTPRSVGYGIGLGIGLWAMQQGASIFVNLFLQRGLITGFMLRAALISVISKKSIRLSGEARIIHTNGKLTTHISADASFMDYAALLSHDLYLQPAQILIGVGILIHLIGYSALVGLAVLVIGVPFQTWLFARLIGTRQTQMKTVDKRVRLLQEILNGIRVIKFMAYEEYFGSRVSSYRREELKELRKNSVMRALMTSVMAFIPVFAAVMSFITYSLSGHELNAAVIFSALQAFNNIRAPLLILPLAIQAMSDAYVGLGRISKCLLGGEIDNPVPVILNAEYAISSHGNYSWETVENSGAGRESDVVSKDQSSNKNQDKEKLAVTDGQDSKGQESATPFALKDIDLDIPRGSFVVVCGRIGSGKSSLIQALLGEMKMVSGTAYLGGSSAYFPQTPWIMNATLKENILFGSEMDDERFTATIKACALESDIAMLTHGIYTEIGEKGINLSGGQKARVCLARAVYCGNEINLFDDPLSAVDAHVSKTLVEGLVSGPLRNKTRVLITHHLEVLPKADLIITMVDGKIAEKGTYEELLAANGVLAKLLAEHVSQSSHDGADAEYDAIETREDVELKTVGIEVEQAAEREQLAEQANKLGSDRTNEGTAAEQTKAQDPGALLTMKEEREVGAVSLSVYARYVRSMGSYRLAPIFLGCFVLAQMGGPKVNLGLAYSVLTFIGSLMVYLSTINASYNLFNAAYAGVMGTPVSWFDATPVGRIISRLSKDITTLDDQLPMQWNTFLTMSLNVFGTVALVFYAFPYLGLIFIPLFLMYYFVATFYRASSREAKRIDSIMRSTIYAQFGESLGGMSSIRAYGAEQRFITRTENAVDVQNKCYFIMISLQRWLGIRLEALGNLLVLAISFFGVGFRNTVSPAKLGVVLTYALALTQIFAQIINIFAQVEQDMNTAERVAYYAELPSEAAKSTADDPAQDWPSAGEIMLRNVVLKYREDLPAVLKGLSFSIGAGEKIGVVGRTGAGKSSLLQALFRIVELTEGSIEVDGVNLRSIGLDPIRRKLGIVPQDPLLWNGTIASNLDPDGTCTPEQLLSALKRTHLLADPDASPEVQARLEKFKLGAMVQDDGANFSAGERQLVALARVVVRDPRIVILDEATSSVDMETDASIQDTIRNEFKNKTIISIAHRLATVAFYDRILIMDAGKVAEFASPIELFDRENSIFRSMCDQAQLTRSDILRIRGELA